MPKLLPDIETKIYQSILKLANIYGYDKLSMKQIAQESDIAVGTLYNYFPDKKALISFAIEKSWQHSFEVLAAILEQPLPMAEKWLGFNDTLYTEIRKRQGLGDKLTRTGTLDAGIHAMIYARLAEMYGELFDGLQTADKVRIKNSDRIRIQETFLGVMLRLVALFDDEVTENRKYLKRLTLSLIQPQPDNNEGV